MKFQMCPHPAEDGDGLTLPLWNLKTGGNSLIRLPTRKLVLYLPTRHHVNLGKDNCTHLLSVHPYSLILTDRHLDNKVLALCLRMKVQSCLHHRGESVQTPSPESEYLQQKSAYGEHYLSPHRWSRHRICSPQKPVHNSSLKSSADTESSHPSPADLSPPRKGKKVNNGKVGGRAGLLTSQEMKGENDKKKRRCIEEKRYQRKTITIYKRSRKNLRRKSWNGEKAWLKSGKQNPGCGN